METVNFVLCGLGGQGVLFMTKILAETALSKGIKVMGAETHGMAQRGGSVISHLRLGEVQSSLVRSGTAHFLLALDENEAYRYLPFLGRKGRLYVNADPGLFPRQEVRPYIKDKGITYHCLPATKEAMHLGAPMASNLALVGFFSAFDEEPFSSGEIRETIERISPSRFRDLNLKVFDACHAIGRENMP